MKKRFRIILIVTLIVIAGYSLYNSNVRAQREHHIFCETLTPDMTKNEVLDSLKVFGEIDYNKTAPFGGSYNEITIGYIDSQVVGHKSYILSFKNGKYIGASVIVFLDDIESVCK